MGFVSVTIRVYSKFEVSNSLEVKSIGNVFKYLTDHDFEMVDFNIFIR